MCRGARTATQSLCLFFCPQKATALPARRAEYFDGSEPVQNRVYKSLKVWSMLADLEESLGTFQVSCHRQGEVELVLGRRAECALTCLFPQSTKAVYDRILDLRIATPQIVINYAMFLEEHKYFEESFKVRQGQRCRSRARRREAPPHSWSAGKVLPHGLQVSVCVSPCPLAVTACVHVC